MAYDIYGNILYPGNCEVHPWVPESYPCNLCRKREMERQHREEMKRLYEEEMQQIYKEGGDNNDSI